MANFLSSSTSITLLLPLLSAIIVLLFVSPAYSTSRLILDHRHETAATAGGGGGGFRVSLRHIDSSQNKNLTKFELLKHAMKRGRKRLQKLNAMTTTTTTTKSSSSSSSSSDDQEIHSTVHAGNGEFLMELSIGTPPVPFSAIMDTGSDLIWTQCQPCKQCFDQSTPLFDPTKSSSFSKLPCSSPLCQSLPISTCGGQGDDNDNDNDDHNTSCDYLYTYGDYSSTQGAMASETFTFENNASVQKVGFGCGDDNQGSGFNQGAGLVGLGRGPLSLVSQLREPKFSYCLTSIDDDDDTKTSSTLLMGSMAEESAKAIGLNSSKTTPLLKNPSQPSFYYLSLEGITVGDTPLAIKKSTFALNEDGSGGLIIDSGTTITYLEQSAFDVVKKEFIAQVKLEVDDSGSTGLDLCFALPAGATSLEVPRLVFHFEGADLELPGENYMIADSSVGLMCLAMGGSSGMSIFGNVQQQNMLVLHDLQKETLSFIPTQCSQL